jgi:hypothetical protein
MKSLFCLFSVLTVFSFALASQAGEWRLLFDGETLNGWHQLGGQAHYAVVDGAIVGTTVAGTPNSFLCTQEEFGDFIFEFEVKQEGLSNSGVQFRSLSRADVMDGRVFGYQCEIDPSARAWSGGIYDEARRGWLARPDENPWSKTAYQHDRWNHFRIEAIGNSMRTWINGIPVSHLIDDVTTQGFIGLQVHSIHGNEEPGARVFWRNLRIQTGNLQPAPLDDRVLIRNWIPNHLSAEESTLGWRMLWDGATSQGWRRAEGVGFPDHGWIMDDGVLTIQASDGAESAHAGDIVTEARFSAFELQLDFWMSKGANSGIKYFVSEKHSMAGKGSSIGLEYQILDDALHPDGKMGAAGNRTLASLYDLIPSRRVVSTVTVNRNPEQWHHARLVVRPDSVVEHWLNGSKVVEYERGSPLYHALVARSKYDQWEGFGLAPEGHLLLQDHGDEVRFRSIKVRSLVP